LFAANEFVVPPHSAYIADSFVGFVMDVGIAGLVWPRGGDLFLVGAGVIDTGYVGTIKVKIINPYSEPMHFTSGSSIGQLVLFKKAFVQPPELVLIEKDEVTSISGRGDDGRINAQFALQ
jgi:deoxycytidine triphosphate deaminase